MAIDLSTLDTRAFRGPEGRLVRAVVKSPRLATMLPEAEITAAFTAYNAARASAEAAKAIPVEEFDAPAMLAPKFEAGETIDPVEFIEQLAAMEAKNQQRARAVSLLDAIPETYVYRIVALVQASVDGFYDQLDQELQSLLDEAEEVLASMPGVTGAESAIRAEKHAEWARWLSLHEDYQALRRDHMELLHASDSSGNFASGRPAIGYAYIRQLDDAIPNFITTLGDGGRTSDRLPFAVLDPADPGHWMAAVAERALLDPAVEYADEAIERAGAATVRAAEQEPGVQPEPGRLAQMYGSNERAMTHSHVARRARSAGADLRAQASRGLVGGRMEIDLSQV